MNANDFNVEEINLIGAVFANTREQTIENIYQVLPDITDNAVKKIAENAITKLERMGNEEFVACDFLSLQA